MLLLLLLARSLAFEQLALLSADVTAAGCCAPGSTVALAFDGSTASALVANDTDAPLVVELDLAPLSSGTRVWLRDATIAPGAATASYACSTLTIETRADASAPWWLAAAEQSCVDVASVAWPQLQRAARFVRVTARGVAGKRAAFAEFSLFGRPSALVSPLASLVAIGATSDNFYPGENATYLIDGTSAELTSSFDENGFFVELELPSIYFIDEFRVFGTNRSYEYWRCGHFSVTSLPDAGGVGDTPLELVTNAPCNVDNWQSAAVVAAQRVSRRLRIDVCACTAADAAACAANHSQALCGGALATLRAEMKELTFHGAPLPDFAPPTRAPTHAPSPPPTPPPTPAPTASPLAPPHCACNGLGTCAPGTATCVCAPNAAPDAALGCRALSEADDDDGTGAALIVSVVVGVICVAVICAAVAFGVVASRRRRAAPVSQASHRPPTSSSLRHSNSTRIDWDADAGGGGGGGRSRSSSNAVRAARKRTASNAASAERPTAAAASPTPYQPFFGGSGSGRQAAAGSSAGSTYDGVYGFVPQGLERRSAADQSASSASTINLDTVGSSSSIYQMMPR